MTIDGQEAGDDELRQVRFSLVVEPQRFRLELPNKEYRGNYVATSGSLELTADASDSRMCGIYMLSQGTMTVCFAKTQYPTDFTAKEGSGRTLLVMKRQSLRDNKR